MTRLGREKILLGGESGSGKTYAWLSMADGMPNSKFVAIEPDDGIAKVAKEYPNLTIKMIDVKSPQLLARVNVFPVADDWSDFYGYVDQVERWCKAGALKEDDWCITEGLDIVTENIRSEYADRVYGGGTQGISSERAVKAGIASSSWDAFINRRRTGAPIIEPSDYDAIYTELRKALSCLAYQLTCNWLGTAGVEQMRSGDSEKLGEDRATREFYANMGMPVKFAGYKRLPRMFDTLVLMTKSLSAGYKMQVFKDRGGMLRGISKDSKVMPSQMDHKNFYNDYMVSMVGWRQERQMSNGLVPPPPPPVHA